MSMICPHGNRGTNAYVGVFVWSWSKDSFICLHSCIHMCACMRVCMCASLHALLRASACDFEHVCELLARIIADEISTSGCVAKSAGDINR